MFTFIVASVILIAGIVISGLVLSKISKRFSLMPSTDSLIKLVIYFILIVYLFPFLLFSNGVVVVVVGVLIVLGFYTIHEFFQYVNFSKIEKQITNDYAIQKILELDNKNLNSAYDIADYFQLKNRDDYNMVIPQIIDNLKSRNKLPSNLVISQGRTVISQ